MIITKCYLFGGGAFTVLRWLLITLLQKIDKSQVINTGAWASKAIKEGR